MHETIDIEVFDTWTLVAAPDDDPVLLQPHEAAVDWRAAFAPTATEPAVAGHRLIGPSQQFTRGQGHTGYVYARVIGRTSAWFSLTKPAAD